MVSKYTFKKIEWVDLVSPTNEEVEATAESYNIPDSIKEELLRPTPRGRVDVHDDFVYVVLHFPFISNISCRYDMYGCDVLDDEYNFVLTKDALITVHQRKSPVLAHISEKFDSPIREGLSVLRGNSEEFFFNLLIELYRNAAHQISDFDDVLQDIKVNIFKGKESKMVSRISTVNHYLLDVKQITRYHGDILNSLEKVGKDRFSHNFSIKFSSILGEYNKMSALLESHREILGDLRTTNDSLLQTANNDAIRVLTIITVIMLPLTLITGFFGMNTSPSLVILDSRSAMLELIGFMAFVAISMYFYFKFKKWI